MGLGARVLRGTAPLCPARTAEQGGGRIARPVHERQNTSAAPQLDEFGCDQDEQAGGARDGVRDVDEENDPRAPPLGGAVRQDERNATVLDVVAQRSSQPRASGPSTCLTPGETKLQRMH